MSTLPENELDLEKLFLPLWAQEGSSNAKYAHYEGEPDRPERRGDRRGPRPPRRDFGPGGNRPGGDNRGRPGGPPKRHGTRDQRQARTDRHGRPYGEGRERREIPPPLPEISVSLIPEEKGVESLARQIKMTGRAYPLFNIAQLILQKPERHQVVFAVKKNAEGTTLQPLFLCALDDTLWLSEDEAIAHVLKKHFATFYQAERTATEPPKGKYTFVAQCGMSGVILGPPNHHDYQNQLRKLHNDRFSRMPFEVYKSRVKIVRDEEVVKKWVEDQSWKTDYVCLNMPEPLKLGSMDAVQQHFRETHKENIIKPVESHKLNGAAARSLRSGELTRMVRTITEDQRRFPLQIATVLSQQFASHGLQFFKVNKAITHVAVARPHYLDLSLTPVSDGVKRIVDYINANPKCNRRHLVEALAPTPPPPPLPVEAAPATEPAGQPQAAPAQDQGPTPEQTAVIADLHWLIHQGHVIEFANGIIECAKKPLPKPPKPEKPKAVEAAAQAEGTPGEPGVPEAAKETQAPVETLAGETEEAPAAAAEKSQAGELPPPETQSAAPAPGPADAPAGNSAAPEAQAEPAGPVGEPEQPQAQSPGGSPEERKEASGDMPPTPVSSVT